MKKIAVLILSCLMLFALCAAPALAADANFTYEVKTLDANGNTVNDLTKLAVGDEVTVTVTLTRTDIGESDTYGAWGLELDINDQGLTFVSGTGFTYVYDEVERVAGTTGQAIGGESGIGTVRFYRITLDPNDHFTLAKTVTVTATYKVKNNTIAQASAPSPLVYLIGSYNAEEVTAVTPPPVIIPVERYEVDFNAKGGVINGNASAVVSSGDVITLPNATKENCTFLGWSDGTNTYAAGSSYTVNSDVTLIAVWQDNAPVIPTGTITVKPAGEGSINEDGTISVTASGPVQVKVTGVSSGQVAAVVDGSGRVTDIIEKSLVENGTAYFCLPGSAKVKIINNAASFSDVRSSDWFASAVTFASSHELFSGMGNGVFAPGAQMTRGMLVTVLWRLEDKPAAASALSFSDVASGDYFYTAVQWAAANGIVKGYTDGSFQPNKSITREEMAALLNRYMDYLGRDTSVRGDLSRFSDGDKVSAWAADNLSWANGAGVITGRPDGTVDPQGTATRAEVAAMLQRIVSALVK